MWLKLWVFLTFYSVKTSLHNVSGASRDRECLLISCSYTVNSQIKWLSGTKHTAVLKPYYGLNKLCVVINSLLQNFYFDHFLTKLHMPFILTCIFEAPLSANLAMHTTAVAFLTNCFSFEKLKSPYAESCCCGDWMFNLVPVSWDWCMKKNKA